MKQRWLDMNMPFWWKHCNTDTLLTREHIQVFKPFRLHLLAICRRQWDIKFFSLISRFSAKSYYRVQVWNFPHSKTSSRSGHVQHLRIFEHNRYDIWNFKTWLLFHRYSWKRGYFERSVSSTNFTQKSRDVVHKLACLRPCFKQSFMPKFDNKILLKILECIRKIS